MGSQLRCSQIASFLAPFEYTDVCTLLNSGNLVFNAPRTAPRDAVPCVEKIVATDLGVPARVTIPTAKELTNAVDENPLLHIADDLSRLLVAVLRNSADRKKLEPLIEQDWSNEVLTLGKGVAYLWCAEGILASRLTEAVRALSATPLGFGAE
jgi:uncharacterized protein (DUF1697 family)